MKKAAFALVMSALLALGVGSAAHAQYGTTPPVTISPSNPAPGATFTLGITGCSAGEVLTTTFNGRTSTTTCTASATLSGDVAALGGTGTASITLQAPTAPGTYSGTVVGNLGFNQSFQVVVAGSATAPGGGLPATGTDSTSTTMAIAFGVFVIGLGLVGVTQVRRRQDTTV